MKLSLIWMQTMPSTSRHSHIPLCPMQTFERYYVIENLLNKYLSVRQRERETWKLREQRGILLTHILKWNELLLLSPPMSCYIYHLYTFVAFMSLSLSLFRFPCLKCHKFNWKFNLSTWKFSVYFVNKRTHKRSIAKIIELYEEGSFVISLYEFDFLIPKTIILLSIDKIKRR